MLTAYIQAAMRRAAYEILEDGTYYGEISDLPGVWANAANLEACRTELQEVLEDWILVGLRRGDLLPIVDGIDLNATTAA
jgi:predicted RNase H-like HicB family nuclease